METVVVTGAAGFIGSHTVDRLLAEGYAVRGIDCFTDNYPAERKEANLRKALANPNFTLLREDLTDMDLAAALEGASSIIHLAAQTSVRGKDPKAYQKNNVDATRLLVEACKGKPLKKFVYASSSSVYGNAPFPTREDMPAQPLSLYGKTKLEGERLVLASGLPAIVLRYFTVFGERQRPDMAISIFMDALFTGKDITIYGTGEQKRDFTYVADVAAANAKALASAETGIFNISGRNVVIVNRLIEELVKITGRHVDIAFKPALPGEVDHTGADITKALNKLNWAPGVQLWKGLEKQMNWYCREVLGQEPPSVVHWKPY
ncbi:MAG: NAD-dependent epimerase/dehydratase family protein [Candidatus Aenigmarchaeota archaeon]|nr:NAD-dependent epimerase/dehydratase family protein [Candidatus Aenigmarchaeota archaeon]